MRKNAFVWLYYLFKTGLGCLLGEGARSSPPSGKNNNCKKQEQMYRQSHRNV